MDRMENYLMGTGCACASNALSLASTSTSYFDIDAPDAETDAFPLAMINF